MKKYSKYMVVVLVLGLTLMTGCNTKKKNEDVTPAPTIEGGMSTPEGTQQSGESETQVPDGTQQPVETPAGGTDAPEETQALSENVKDLPIYTIQNETLDTEAYVAKIPKDSEITAQLVVNTVVSTLKEYGLEIGIDSISQEGEAVIVSFEPDKAPLTDVGAGVEATILDCVSQSLLDNIATCKKVIFRSGGKAYESGHMIFEIDEPYNW